MACVSKARYIPTENEPYMSEGQLLYFKDKLNARKEELAGKLNRTIKRIKALEGVQADILDRSNVYIDLEREVNNFERYSKVMDQVGQALGRIEAGSFGYCEMTGSEIGLRRPGGDSLCGLKHPGFRRTGSRPKPFRPPGPVHGVFLTPGPFPYGLGAKN